MTTPLYSIGTWDTDEQAFTPQVGVPAFNLALFELRQSMRMLRDCGYSCHRYRDAGGSYDDNDTSVMVERTDGKSEAEIREGWKR
jgi:hypothetical protein